MNVVDSSGWLAYFSSGKNAQFFAPIIRETGTLVVPSICMVEVFKRLLIQRDEEAALQAVGLMSLGTLADLNREISIHAAQISVAHKIAMAIASSWQLPAPTRPLCGRRMLILRGSRG